VGLGISELGWRELWGSAIAVLHDCILVSTIRKTCSGKIVPEIGMQIILRHA